MPRNPKNILDAIARNEGKSPSMQVRGVAEIAPEKSGQAVSLSESPAFGMWADRDDMADPAAYVRQLRKGRFDAL